MNRIIKVAVRLLLACVFLITAGVSTFAAEVRRVPDYDSVEQGFMALTLDAEGAENFRYCGLENKLHTYRGKIKPGGQLKLTIQATLGNIKTLPLTGRGTSVRMQVIAKKGKEVIKAQNFRKDNEESLFLNYTVPEEADALEVNETFIVNNKSKNIKYNQSLTSRNRLILSATDEGTAVALSANTNGGNGSAFGDGKGSNTVLFAGAAALAAVAGGGFLFMKKKKEKQEGNRPLEEEQMLIREAEQQRFVQARMEDTVPRFCSNCGAELEPGSRFCGNCGNRNPSEFCSNCGAKLKPDSIFCENCGAKV